MDSKIIRLRSYPHHLNTHASEPCSCYECWLF